MQVPLDNVDPEKLGGLNLPEPGEYHFEVLHVDEEDPKTSCMIVDCEVLAGKPAGQQGKVHREYFSLTPASMGKVVQFAVALGMISEQEVARAKAAGETPSLDFAVNGIGRQFCGRLTAETYEGKTRNKLNFHIWAVDSPKAKGIPIDKAKLAELKRQLASEATGRDDPFGRPAGGNGKSAANTSTTVAGGLGDDLF